jgi:agmatinase
MLRLLTYLFYMLSSGSDFLIGGRFGTQAVRQASSRQNSFRGFNHRAGVNPYRSWARVVDCGDIHAISFDHQGALSQFTDALWGLSHRQAATNKKVRKPKLVSIGGDRTSTRLALHALSDVYHGRIAVVSFGASHDISGYEDFIDFNFVHTCWISCDA